jgi:hypothetical protein
MSHRAVVIGLTCFLLSPGADSHCRYRELRGIILIVPGFLSIILIVAFGVVGAKPQSQRPVK